MFFLLLATMVHYGNTVPRGSRKHSAAIVKEEVANHTLATKSYGNQKLTMNIKRISRGFTVFAIYCSSHSCIESISIYAILARNLS